MLENTNNCTSDLLCFRSVQGTGIYEEKVWFLYIILIDNCFILCVCYFYYEIILNRKNGNRRFQHKRPDVSQVTATADRTWRRSGIQKPQRRRIADLAIRSEECSAADYRRDLHVFQRHVDLHTPQTVGNFQYGVGGRRMVR